MAIETRLTDADAREMVGAGYWRNQTPADALDRWAREIPRRTAVMDGAGRMTWEELARATDRVASGLAALGVGSGDVISCQLPNWNEFILTVLAACRVGAIVNPIPPIYRAHELRYILGLTEARALVIPSTFRGFDYVRMIEDLAPELPRLEHVFVCRGERGRLRGFEDLGRAAPRASFAGTLPNSVSEVIFTSGTTGEPKGVMHTWNTILSVIYPLIDRFRFSAADVVLMASTFAHQTGYLYGLSMTLLLGATGVWLDVWSGETAAGLIERERVTFTMGATPFLADLTGSPALATRDISSLRVFISAGASIPRKLVVDARARLGCAISAGWGMTENGLVTCNGLDDPEDKVAGSDGRPLDGLEVRVVGADGRPLPSGAEGDLEMRGHSLFVGYWRRPEFTRESFTDAGWFRTGDRAEIDAEGYLSITGRTKDIIIRGGENIQVVEIENLLFGHPKVGSVAVVAMPDPRLQERACAFVIPKPGERVTLEELCAYLEGKRVARQKFPERLELVSEFPMTPSGKIQKFRLREMVAKKLEIEGRRTGEGAGKGRDG